MLEKQYFYAESADKLIEKVIDDDNINLNHMILPKGENLPEHYTNSNVYFIIVSGTMSLQLGEQEVKDYSHHCFLNIPFNVKMNVKNNYDEILEFFVIKSPNPKNYQK